MQKNKVIIIVIDALRPDSITKGSMPTLWTLAERGVRFSNHYTCSPSKTRVASATIATGCYPSKHGLVNNQLYCSGAFINVSNYQELMQLDSSPAGPLLSIPTLTERLDQAGFRVALSTASSSGTSFIQNPSRRGFSVNNGSPSFVFPEARKDAILARFGSAPKVQFPDVERNKYAARILTEHIIAELQPDLAMIWFSDPDKTQHPYGPGAPETLQALGVVDQCIADIVETLQEQDLLDRTDLLILSDHGCISADPNSRFSTSMAKEIFPEDLASKFVLVGGNSIYIKPGEEHAAPEIIYALQQDQDIGAIFSSFPNCGTLPLALIGQEHERSPDILFYPHWTTELSEYGVPGIAKGTPGHGHGGTSRYEMNATLVAYGPSFKDSTTINTPSGNIDIAPTVLHLFGQPIDPILDGRVLTEAMKDGASPGEIVPKELSFTSRAEYPDFTYEATARIARIDNTYYLRQANGTSTKKEI